MFGALARANASPEAGLIKTKLNLRAELLLLGLIFGRDNVRAEAVKLATKRRGRPRNQNYANALKYALQCDFQNWLQDNYDIATLACLDCRVYSLAQLLENKTSGQPSDKSRHYIRDNYGRVLRSVIEEQLFFTEKWQGRPVKSIHGFDSENVPLGPNCWSPPLGMLVCKFRAACSLIGDGSDKNKWLKLIEDSGAIDSDTIGSVIKAARDQDAVERKREALPPMGLLGTLPAG